MNFGQVIAKVADLFTEAAHALIDHTGLTGVGISQATHNAGDHTGVPGVPTGGFGTLYESAAEVTGNLTGADANTLSEVTGLSIAAGHLVRIVAQVRKTAGAASSPDWGLKLNGTQVWSSNGSPIASSSGTNEVESGWFCVEFVVPSAAYPAAALQDAEKVWSVAGAANANTHNRAIDGTPDILIPNGPITSVTITGDAVNALNTIASKNLKVYDLG